MRRTLASAALAASIGAASLCALVMLLNPQLSLTAELPALILCLFFPWAAIGWLMLSLLAFFATALRFRPRPFHPVLPRRPFFASLAFVMLAVVAALYWHNLLAYRHAVPIEAVRAIAACAVVIAAGAAVLVAVGVDMALFPRHERPIAAVLAVLAPAASVALPLALRPAMPLPAAPVPVRLEASRPERRVYIVGIDGLSPSDLGLDPASPGVPWLARLAQRGAVAPLNTVRPTEGATVWTTLMTGQLPRDHGIRSASQYRLLASRSEWALLPKGALVGSLERAHLLERRPVPSTSRQRRAIWNVFDAFGIPSGLVAVPGTHPPEAIPGFVVSPYFHLLRRDAARASAAFHPRDLLSEARARTLEPADIDPALLRELAETAAPGGSPFEDPPLRRLAEQAIAPDLTYERVADVLRQAYDPALFVIAFHGYDEAAHSFYRYAHPEAFGNVPPDEARRYRRVLSGYAGFLGQWVGRLEKELRPGDVLIVVSGRGLAPTPLWRRLLGVLTGTDVGTAWHAAHAPGVLVAVGDAIRPGSEVKGASVLDLAPTTLYLMGLPVARDMRGRVLTEIVDLEFAADNPLTFIPSYQGLAAAHATVGHLDDLPLLPEDQP